LFGWPAVCVVFFVMLPVELAAIWSMLTAYLLLPSAVSVDVHYLPALDKGSISALSTFVLCKIKGTQSLTPRRSFLIYFFALLFVISPVFTSLNNSYELHIGDRSIPGFYPLNGLKFALSNALTLMPFFVGMRFLSTDRARELLLKSLPISALFYSLPMLLEVRLSPQLQRLVYGSNPAGFITLVRAGGFRPLVFLNNGLELALFTSMALIAAVAAFKARLKFFRLSAGAVATYLVALLMLCKTFGAMIYGATAVPLLLIARPKTWVTLSFCVSLILCAYPMLRTHDLVPVKWVSATARSVSSDRGGSFDFRIQNEDRLLAKANQKPFLGWGTWGRNRVYDEESGTDLSITDGAWILRFGMLGWVGYLALFGLFSTAIFSAFAGVRAPVTSATIVLGGLTLILAVNLIDLIPNANLLPLTFVLAGAISGSLRTRATPRARATRVGQTTARSEVELVS
jgi:hypothetical protein